MNKLFPYLVLIFSLIIIDQVTKALIQQHFYLGESYPVIDNFFSLTYVRNSGAAFGMGNSAPDWVRWIVFKIIPVFAVIWIISLLYQSREKNRRLKFAYSLILAGAVGNLWDRFTLDYVVDFFDFYYLNHHYPAFNIADSCITVAAGLLIWDMIRENKVKK